MLKPLPGMCSLCFIDVSYYLFICFAGELVSGSGNAKKSQCIQPYVTGKTKGEIEHALAALHICRREYVAS